MKMRNSMDAVSGCGRDDSSSGGGGGSIKRVTIKL